MKLIMCMQIVSAQTLLAQIDSDRRAAAERPPHAPGCVVLATDPEPWPDLSALTNCSKEYAPAVEVATCSRKEFGMAKQRRARR